MENLDNVVYKKPVIRQFENVTGHHWFNQLEKRILTDDYGRFNGHKVGKERGCNFSILVIDLRVKFQVVVVKFILALQRSF